MRKYEDGMFSAVESDDSYKTWSDWAYFYPIYTLSSPGARLDRENTVKGNWLSSGIAVTAGTSRKVEYNAVKVKSDVSNPSLFSNTLDNELQKKKKKSGAESRTPI